MEPLPFREIPDYPGSWTAGTAVGRVVDGLGFRYHWATEGLRREDLEYRPGPSNRSVLETLQHILQLVSMVEAGLDGRRYVQAEEPPSMDLDTLRAETLGTVRRLSERFKGMETPDLEASRLLFGGKREYDFPLWHALNGPLADALYHIGQIVGYRRASGNAMDPGVSVFLGKRRE